VCVSVCECAVRYKLQGHHQIFRVGQNHIYMVKIRCESQGHHQIFRVGQNHIYTVNVRYIWLGNHKIYGHTRWISKGLANPN